MPEPDSHHDGPPTEGQTGRLLPSIVAGSVAGFYAVIFMFSYASVVFAGDDLARFLPNGIGALLFGAMIISLVLALTSSLPGLIASPNDNPVAISAVMAAAVAQAVGDSASPEAVFNTVAVTIASGTMLTGLAFVFIGRFRLANLVRFIPYPVIGGFLAGTGLILVRGAFVASSDVPLTLGGIPSLMQFDAAKLWMPALAFGVVMLIVLHRYSHFLIVPGVVAAGITIFYVGLLTSGMSLDEAVADGWLIRTASEGGIWKPIGPSALAEVHWPVVLGQTGMILTLTVVSVIAILLNTTALESAFGEDIDVDHELRSAGLANVVAGLGGSVAGYHYVGMTVLMRKMGANRRLVGVIVALVCLAALVFGPAFVSRVPRYILGGLAFFIGLDFLHDWVYASIRKLAKLDVAIILVIMAVMASVGPLQGVVLGTAISVALFVLRYSRINVVRHVFSGASFHSNLERPRAQRHLLGERGGQIHILRLHGYIFFGTATKILSIVRDRAKDPEKPTLRFVILDFQQVDGLDSSALHSLVKIKQLAQEQDFDVVFAHVPADVERCLETETFLDGSPLVPHSYPELDHALEWCEDQILAQAGLTPTVDEHPLREWLEQILPHADAVERFAAHLDRVETAAGDVFIHEGEHAEALYFVESGRLTVQLERPGVPSVRLRTVGPGAVVGAAGMFMGAAHHNQLASVVADRPSILHRLSASDFAALKHDEPAVTAAFQEYVIHYLAERLSSSLRLVEDMLAYDA